MTESNKWTCIILILNDIFPDLSCTTNNTYFGGHPYARTNLINDLKLYSNPHFICLCISPFLRIFCCSLHLNNSNLNGVLFGSSRLCYTYIECHDPIFIVFSGIGVWEVFAFAFEYREDSRLVVG